MTLCLSPLLAKDLSVYKYAYQGDYQGTCDVISKNYHKDLETRMNSYLIVAYMNYRFHDMEGILEMFEGLDKIIAEELIKIPYQPN